MNAVPAGLYMHTVTVMMYQQTCICTQLHTYFNAVPADL